VRKAILDVGSNSVLMIVAEQTPTGWNLIEETSAVTALGEGTKQTGLLSEGGMSRTLEAIQTAFLRAKELGANEVFAGVTMAARIASNTPEFLARAQAQQTAVVVLSGEEEAQLGFLAVADDPIFADCPRISIIDVGGHSTELVTADRAESGWNVRFRRSYPIGTLAIRGEMHDQASLDGLDLMRVARDLDDRIGLCYRPHQSGQAVVLGATGTNLVTIRERMTDWQPELVHGVRLDYEEVSKAAGWLSPMTDQERAAVIGIENGREKSIHLGAIILERFLYTLRTIDCRVSVRGWRYALLDYDRTGRRVE
jgi:exopolyphosphatase / guanosine-5'-triphosphate,3'-diphosphate pyrophosphatase